MEQSDLRIFRARIETVNDRKKELEWAIAAW